jgi:hypothetical protein
MACFDRFVIVHIYLCLQPQAGELRMQSLARMAEAAEEEARAAAAASSGQGAQELATVADASTPSSSSGGAAQVPAAGSDSSSSSQAGPSSSYSWPAAPFASMALGGGHVSLGRASRVVLDTLTKAAKAVPMRRPRLIRPSQVQRSGRIAAAGHRHQQGAAGFVAAAAAAVAPQNLQQ